MFLRFAPRFGRLEPPWNVVEAWIGCLSLALLLIALLRRRGRAPWSVRLGAAAMTLLILATGLDWGRSSSVDLTTFPRPIPSWWLAWRALVAEHRMIVDVLGTAGVLLLALVLVELVSSIRARRRRAWVAAQDFMRRSPDPSAEPRPL
ncbi:MAG: hypothetical protein U0575_03605 [Phycisphaerales bacterium]